MPVTKLTKRAVDAAIAATRPIIYYDSELVGFCLKVLPSGAKRWCVEYRAGAGGRRVAKTRMVLGSTTKLTPDQARSSAKELLASVTLGNNPAAARSASREMPNFREFCERYLAEEAQAKLKPRTVINYRIYLRKHAAPVIGSIKLDALSTEDIAKLHRRVGKTTPMTANRVVEFIGSVYRYAAVCGLVQRGANPASHIEAYREERRERFLSSEELGRLGEAIREAETTGIPWPTNGTSHSKHTPKKNPRTKIAPRAAAALRLLILTGARLREILELRWEYVDIERGLLLLPDSKTGRKSIVLNAPALAVLASLPRIGSFVVAGETGDRPRHDLNRPWRLVGQRAGLKDTRLHDLRHTHASYGAGAGLGLPIIGKLLGHSQPSTTARYAHLDNDPLRRATNTIGKLISNAMGEPSHQPIRPSSSRRQKNA